MVAFESVITLLSVCMSLCLQCLTSDVYIVSSKDGRCPGGACYNISTFGKMANSFSNTTGLVVHFLEGTHMLDLIEPIVFTNLTNAVFEGEGNIEQGFHETVQQSTVVINCTHNSGGIAFLEGFNVTIKYITICNCGVSMQGLLYRNVSLSAGNIILQVAATLGLFYVGDIIVDHVSLQNWSAGGLVVVSSGFDLSISNSSFSNKNGIYVMGADVGHVALIYTDPLDCAPQNSIYMYNNAAITNTNVSFGSPYYMTTKIGFFVCFTQRTYKVQLMMDSVVAFGSHVGNILVCSSETDAPNYNLSVNNVHISHGSGFGLIVNTGSWSDVVSSSDCAANLADSNLTIFINNSVITRNICLSRYMIASQFIDIRYSVMVVIQSTEISNNKNFVSGLYFSIITYYRQSMFVNLTNVITKNNSRSEFYHEFFPTTQKYNSISAAYVTSLRLKNVTIADNNMTGLAVYRTNVEVSSGSASVIHNNTGIDGGGLAFYGESYLLLEDSSLLTFTNNTAQRGGAMFVDASTASPFNTQLEPCFYQFPGNSQSRSGKVTLSGNQAIVAGSVLFGSTTCDLFGSLDQTGVMDILIALIRCLIIQNRLDPRYCHLNLMMFASVKTTYRTAIEVH